MVSIVSVAQPVRAQHS